MTNETITALMAQLPQVTIGQALTRKIRACEGEAAAQLVLEKVVLDAMRTAVEVERERCAKLCETLAHGAFGSPAYHTGVRDGSIGCAMAIRKGETPAERTPCEHKNTQSVDPTLNGGHALRCLDCGWRKKPDGSWGRP
jgi:hypothetical protein